MRVLPKIVYYESEESILWLFWSVRFAYYFPCQANLSPRRISMTEQELVFTLASFKLGGAFLLGLYLRFQAVRALEADAQTVKKSGPALGNETVEA